MGSEMCIRDSLRGDAGRDGLGGGDGNDRLFGGTGNDVIGGGAGNDRLFGNAGNDQIRGGQGDDTMTGGAGGDTFQFVRGRSGDDVITDFDETVDILSVNLRGAQAAIVDVQTVGADTVVSFGSASVTLEDVDLAASEIVFQFI